jgi:integration host factor subunit alpha
MTVTKKELTEHLYNAIGLSKAESKSIVESFFDTIRATLAQGKEVKLSGFGNFTVREKRARPGRNPKTGEPSVVTARRVVSFQASHLLKAHCNQHLTLLRKRKSPADRG